MHRAAPWAPVAACLGGVALLFPLASALNSTVLPLTLRLVLVALWVLTAIQPHLGLIAIAAAVPFGSLLLDAMDVAAVRYTEALVLATLSAALIAAGRSPRLTLRPQAPSIALPAVVFCGIAICSAAVVLAVAQVGMRLPWLFLRSFGVFLTHDYLAGPPVEFAGVPDAALLLEGIGLLFLVARHARDGVMRPIHLQRALVAGGLVAVVLTLARQIMDAAASRSIGGFVVDLVKRRTSVHVMDANAAGAFFAMTGLVALGMALWHPASGGRTERADRVARSWLAAAILLFLGTWVSGSRTAVLAFVGTGVLAVAARPLQQRRWRNWPILAVGVPAALALATLVATFDPRAEGGRSLVNIVGSRAAFVVTGVRMIATSPWFGVGIGRYYEMSGQFMPQSIYWFFFHENAHNNFLQIGGELGTIGLAAFLWLLVAAAIRLTRGLRAHPSDQLLLGSTAALAAFLVTWMTSHPLLVPEVAYPFWLLLGVAIARADGNVQRPLAFDAPPVSQSSQPLPYWIAHALTAGVILLLIASVPIRARREAARLDLGKQTYGLYDWEGESAGGDLRFRWSSRRGTFFIPGGARELSIPLRAIHIGRNMTPTTVSIAIGGRTLHRVTIPHDDWITVRILLPRDTGPDQFHRIDITTSPAWSPAALVAGRTDVRILGVQVGEPSTQ